MPRARRRLRRASAALSSMRHSGFCLVRLRPRRGTAIRARVRSIKVTSAGDADSRRFPKGTPWPSATTLHCVPFRTLALLGGADTRPPFLAGAKLPSAKASAQSQLASAIEVSEQGAPCRQPDLLLFPAARTAANRCWARDRRRAGLCSARYCEGPTRCPRNRDDWGPVWVPPRRGLGFGQEGRHFPPAHHLVHSDGDSYQTPFSN